MSREKLPLRNIFLGERLRQVRDAHSLTQQVFAKALTTSAGYISEIEAGKKMPGSEFLMSLKQTYNIDTNWLLAGEGDMYIKKGVAAGGGEKIDIKDIPIYNIKEWLEEFWANASEDERAWLKIEFGRAFPEYKDWLLKKELAEAGDPPISHASGAA